MGKLKKWMMCALACVLVSASASPVQAAKTGIASPLCLEGTVAPARAESLEVLINARIPVTFAAVDVSIEYDTSVLEVAEGSYGMTDEFMAGYVGGQTFCYNNLERGSVYFTGASTNAAAYEGTVGRVTFTVRNPEAGGVTSLKLRIGNLAENATAGLVILNPVQQYWIPLGEVEGTYGDVDGDGSVTLNDAYLALKIALCAEQPEDGRQAVLADMDRDTFVSLTDVQSILRTALGIG